jgi:uncharacterized repeat protein (TIGR01451 family)
MQKIISTFILLATLMSVASAGTYTTNASRDFVVVPVGSIPAQDYCTVSDGRAFPGDEVTIHYTVQNVGNVNLENVVLKSSLTGNVPLRFKKLIPMQVTSKSMVIVAPNKYGTVTDNVTLTATYPDEPGAWPKAKITILTMREKPMTCKCPNEIK